VSDADGVTGEAPREVPEGHEVPTANHPNDDDTSGVSDMVEEGAPLEPQDVVEAEGYASAPEVEADPLVTAEAKVTDLTADLQRLQAEYLNYKRRVDRDRELYTENATFKALMPIIEVLDTVDRAREAGEVEGGFRAVVDQLATAVERSGLTRYAAPGDAFDPTLHEALTTMGTDPEVSVTTVKVVAKAGYRIGNRVVRVAQVLVVEPA
jgi:molecular chaperone GrpE